MDIASHTSMMCTILLKTQLFQGERGVWNCQTTHLVLEPRGVRMLKRAPKLPTIF